MSIPNIAKGRVVELYKRVAENDPATAALLVIPVESSGIETDATLLDKDTVADFFAGTTTEQTTMGRKTLTDAELAAVPSPDDVNDRYEVSLPSVTWTAATGNAIAKLLIAYDPDPGTSTDSTRVPIAFFAFSATPDGTDLTMTGGAFFRASEPA